MPLTMIDQINEKTRAARLLAMYEHILGRASGFPEMKRIIEPPMHIDSVLSSNIQFSDWIAACVTRAIRVPDHQGISLPAGDEGQRTAVGQGRIHS